MACLLRGIGSRVMPRDQLRLALDQFWKLSFQGRCDLAVALATATQQQRLIGRVLDQRMAECVSVVWRWTYGEYDFRGDQPLQRAIELILGFGADGAQQRTAKLATDDRELGDFFCIGAESVEPCQQRCLQRLSSNLSPGTRLFTRLFYSELAPLLAPASDTLVQEFVVPRVTLPGSGKFGALAARAAIVR